MKNSVMRRVKMRQRSASTTCPSSWIRTQKNSAGAEIIATPQYMRAFQSG